MPEHSSSFVRSAGVVSSITMISRVLGLVRDQVITYFFGAGAITDAFFVAFGIPNLLRRLFGEGALNAATVPVISERIERGEQEEAWELVTNLMNLLALVLTALTIMGILLAPVLIRLMAWGFVGSDEKFVPAVRLLRLMFPYAIFICLAALEMGALNSFKHFAVPAAAPILLNISMIAFTVFAAVALRLPMERRIDWVAYGVLAGGICQMMIQIPPMLRRGWHFEPQFRATPDVKLVGRLMLPAALGQAVTQINLMADRLLASFLPEASITYLYYANRLVQLPLGVFGIAISTAVLPYLSRHAARGDWSNLTHSLVRSLRLAYFICLPATIGLVMLRIPIVAALFERGKFSPESTAGTAWALMFYAVGLFSFSAVKITAQAFYSMKDTRTPVLVGSVSMVANIILNILLMRTFLKHGGLALATSISSSINFVLLLLLLRTRTGEIRSDGLPIALIKLSAAGLIMGGVVHFCLILTESLHPILQVAIAVPAGVVSYVTVCLVLRSSELKEVIKRR